MFLQCFDTDGWRHPALETYFTNSKKLYSGKGGREGLKAELDEVCLEKKLLNGSKSGRSYSVDQNVDVVVLTAKLENKYNCRVQFSLGCLSKCTCRRHF